MAEERHGGEGAGEFGGSVSMLRRAALWTADKIANMAGGVTLSLTDPRLGQFVGGGPTITGHTINDESAMRITTAFACVRVLAETVGAVTLKVYEKQKNGNAVEVDHDLADVLVTRPNSDMTGLEYREAMTTNLAGRGNGYSLIERRGGGNVASLYPVPASRCHPKRKEDGSVVFVYNDRGRQEELPQDRVWHWKGFSWGGLVGLSPIECARQAMGLALAGEEANARLFRNGLGSTAVIKVPQWLKADQRKIAEEKLDAMHQGLLNYGKPYLLEGGMDIGEGIFAPRDAQFLELRKFQLPELCRIWRISPHMIADLERATNNNIEQLSLEFVMYTMMPYFRRVEERGRELFKPSERDRFFIRFNFESLLRADSTARAQLYAILLQNGVYSRNEVRALENRNRVDSEGMDDYTVQSNMALLQLLDTINKASSSKAAPAAAAPSVWFSEGSIKFHSHEGDRSVTVQPPVVNVAAPAAPIVNVTSPSHTINVQSPDIRVEVPTGPQDINIRSMPDRTITSEVTRNDAREITKTFQTEKDA